MGFSQFVGGLVDFFHAGDEGGSGGTSTTTTPTVTENVDVTNSGDLGTGGDGL
jgi:hypothetical protein